MTRIFLILSIPIALAACETVEGLGEDIETGGEALQDSADDAQSDL